MNTTVGYECVVTPYVGVWIETPRYIGMNVLMTSLLMWECGLKLGCDPIVFGSWCHSLCGSVDWNYRQLTDRWSSIRHSLCGSVDWNKSSSSFFLDRMVTPYVGVWIETGYWSMQTAQGLSHSLCGSVDWNIFPWILYLNIIVTPYVGVWIETCTSA